MDYVFVFTDARVEVARFYREVIGVTQESEKSDASWFRAENAQLAIHDREDEETTEEVARGEGFVLGIRVADVQGAYQRAQAAGQVVGKLYQGKPHPYFCARDPEGRFVIVAGIERA